MICMNCGNPAGDLTRCPVCGSDLALQSKVLQISDDLYNRGLDKAGIRDMAGAIDLLERSLKYNKRNITARNLLGLVYFEVGEVVAALSEWVISKNMMPEDNLASEFIDKVQANPAWLETLQETIKRYNRALEVSKSGDDDVAIMMLKKVVAANTNFIKAHHLLAFLYMKHGQYERARKILKRTIHIDKTNATTLRFLTEIDEQTGINTNLEVRAGSSASGGKSFFGVFKKKQAQQKKKDGIVFSDEEWEESTVHRPSSAQPAVYRRLSSLAAFLNLAIGIVIGALVIGFVVVPSISQDANRETQEKVAGYASDIVSRDAVIAGLKDEISMSEETVNSANAQIAEATEKTEAYERLFTALNYYNSGDKDTAAGLLSDIDPGLLSIDATVLYNNISSDINDARFTSILNEGIEAFQAGDYAKAIESLNVARGIKPDDYNTLSYLAHSYRLSGDTASAKDIFSQIIELFPGTHRAETAQRYLSMLP